MGGSTILFDGDVVEPGGAGHALADVALEIDGSGFFWDADDAFDAGPVGCSFDATGVAAAHPFAVGAVPFEADGGSRFLAR
jgi:hypothetical protein